MAMTRKQFLEWSATALAAGAAARYSSFDLLAAPRDLVEDVLNSAAVRKVHEAIAGGKEQHVKNLQDDLRQPSVSSWHMGIDEMAGRMVEHFKKIGCQEANTVKTDGNPGVWAYYAGAGRSAKTISRYMMYDTQPFDEKRWSNPPLEARRVKMAPFPEVIMARGATNSKGPNRMFLNALESILEVDGKLPVNIMFTCDGEEEQGSPHFVQVIDRYRDRLRSCSAHLNPGPSQNRSGDVSMSLGNKGLVFIELASNGAAWGRGPQKMPIHSSRRAILDSPVIRLVQAFSSMVSDDGNRILVPGYYDAIRKPNGEEERLLKTLVARFGDRLFASESENVKTWMNDWDTADAAWHLTFDTTLNIDGIWGGYTGPGMATILPEKATMKIDSRLVPDQKVDDQIALIRKHLDTRGFTDLTINKIAAGDEWSQTSVEATPVQAVLAVYKRAGIEPQVWPRTAGSSPEWEYTRKIGMPSVGGGLGHGGRAHSDDEYIVIEGTDKVAGIVAAEQSIADILFLYGAWPEKKGSL